MKTALVVLGMHRSGTSSVAGTLTLLGAAPPKNLMAPAADNPRGFWESDVVMALNDTLLAERGLVWSDWRHNSGGCATGADPRILEALRSEFGEADMVVLKDPRMCRLFPEWLRALANAGYEARVVSPLRPPSEVAASLGARNPLSRDHGLRLWLRHVLEAEAASRGLPRHLMIWSDFLADWRSQLAVMNGRLAIELMPVSGSEGDAIDTFLSADLHRQKTSAPVPFVVAQVWETLRRLAIHGEHPDLHRSLDGLRMEFDRAGALFGDAP